MTISDDFELESKPFFGPTKLGGPNIVWSPE